MTELRVAPYGTWKSPVTAALVVAESVHFQQVVLDGEDLYWLEQRPSAGGRSVVVHRRPDGTITDLTAAPFNVRTRVHEYGGGAFTVRAGRFYFSHDGDQRLYAQDGGSTPMALTTGKGLRYADADVDSTRARLVLVREDHRLADREAVNAIVSLSADGSHEQVLVSGYDFYAAPRLSPDGSRLAWLAWNHPHMPWDGTELWTAPVRPDGTLGEPRRQAGGPDESIFQPCWSPSGVLYWVSDKTGWWNLYREQEGGEQPICPMEAEFGRAQWVFGLTTYGFLSEQAVLCVYQEQGREYMAVLNPDTGSLQPRETSFAAFESLQVANGRAAWIAQSASGPAAIMLLEPGGDIPTEVRRASSLHIDPGFLSVPEHIEFPTEHGLTAFGYLYRPQNSAYRAPEGENPPLLVKSHGGPTDDASSAFSAIIQYWTSRGIAVLVVNYGGSTGYGRAFRRRLNGLWGVVDVEDCVNGALYLARAGAVDGKRLLIDGGSAGGYTTLAVLTFRSEFRAGASYYGVSDIEALATDTHKFESRYMDSLVGPYPEQRALYRQRSPINHVDRLARPLILFQGLEDKVVPPAQAVTMYQAVKAKGLPVAYLPFEGEQHGFRQAGHIQRALEAEFYFFARVLGYDPPETIDPVAIANLD